MSEYLPLFLVLIALIAVILRADFLLTLVYLLVGTYAIGRWWSGRAIRSVTIRRHFTDRIFLGERLPVRLEIHNQGWLPVVWLQFVESLPFELTVYTNQVREVISLGPKSHARFDYLLEGRRRGYYSVGPLLMYSGDLFGVSGQQRRQEPPAYLTVYPKIVPLTQVQLPSFSPLGTLRNPQPLFEDPTRVRGKRDYATGDSLRRVDWKATASTGRMQVKLFEPSIALETAIFLNLNSPEYEPRTRPDSTELAIVVAASLANWITGRRQSVGLLTNGLDPLRPVSDVGDCAGRCPLPVPPRQGRAHLMRILDILARIQTGDTYPFVELLRRGRLHLGWGTTLVLITPYLDVALFDELFQARRAGLSAVLIPCGPIAEAEVARRRAESFGFPFYQIYDERDLDRWRQ